LAGGAKHGGLAQDLRRATATVEPDLTLPDLDLPGREGAPPRGQAEFVQTPADYIKEANIKRLAERAKTLAAEHSRTLAAIEQKFGVPGNVLLAIWGRETDFGSYKLPKNAITVLATQGYYGRRKDMFRQELLYALQMLEEGHIKLADMKSSWGGAMGLTQFLPSEFYKHAVDFDGDGKKGHLHLARRSLRRRSSCRQGSGHALGL
jgi:membrane-bound lytic murein transglycosylase B